MLAKRFVLVSWINHCFNTDIPWVTLASAYLFITKCKIRLYMIPFIVLISAMQNDLKMWILVLLHRYQQHHTQPEKVNNIVVKIYQCETVYVTQRNQSMWNFLKSKWHPKIQTYDTLAPNELSNPCTQVMVQETWFYNWLVSSCSASKAINGISCDTVKITAWLRMVRRTASALATDTSQ